MAGFRSFIELRPSEYRLLPINGCVNDDTKLRSGGYIRDFENYKSGHMSALFTYIETAVITA